MKQRAAVSDDAILSLLDCLAMRCWLRKGTLTERADRASYLN